jgi:hypothetical protein
LGLSFIIPVLLYPILFGPNNGLIHIIKIVDEEDVISYEECLQCTDTGADLTTCQQCYVENVSPAFCFIDDEVYEKQRNGLWILWGLTLIIGVLTTIIARGKTSREVAVELRKHKVEAAEAGMVAESAIGANL